MSFELHENMNLYVHGTLENKPFAIAAVPAFSEEAR
jgi:hypothetical protein